MSEEGRVPFDELYAQRAWVRALALRLVRDPGAADDLEQETWIAAARNAPRRDNVRGWLGTVLRNRAWKLRRGRDRRSVHEAVAPTRDTDRAPDEIVAAAEMHRRVVNFVMDLDEPYRSVVVLRFFEDLPIADVARRLDVPLETARTRLRRALEMLRARLDPEDGDRRGAWAVVLLGFDPSTGAQPTGAAASALKGAAVMASTKHIAAAVAAALLLGATTWFVARSDEPAKGDASRDVSAASAAPKRRDAASTKSGDIDGSSRDATPPARDAAVPIDRARDLHGEVVDADGKPVAGAAVRVVAPRTVDAFTLPANETPAAVVATATDGTFRFRLVPGDAVDLIVEAKGFADLRVSRVQAGERLRVVLSRGVRLVVTVRDADGRPASDVELVVSADPPGWAEPGRPWTPTRRARTDADGRAVVEPLPSRGAMVVTAWPARDGGRAATTVKLPRDGETKIEIKLPAGVLVRGRVFDATDGHPIAGARVRSVLPDAGEGATTDVAGQFALAGLRTDDGAARVRVSAVGFVSESVSARSDGFVEAALRPSASVMGRVVDAGGAAVAGARIAVFGAGGGAVGDVDPAPSDSEGRFRVVGLDPRTACVLEISAAGRGAAEVRVPADESNRAHDVGDVRLADAGRIVGVVRRENGDPAPRVAVYLLGNAVSRLRFTDDLGRFVLADVPSGKWRVGVSFAGPPSQFQDATVAAAAPVELSFVVRLRDVRIETVDEAGRPAADVEVELQSNRPMPLRATTGTDGATTMTFEGRGALVVKGTGDRTLLSRPNSIVLRPTQTVARFTMIPAAHVAGVVLDTDGRPMAGATYDVSADGIFAGRFRTDAQGRFDAVVPAAATRTVVELLGAPPSPGKQLDDTLLAGSVEFASGVTDLVLRAVPVAHDGALTARVLAPDGSPVAGAKVRASTPAFRVFEATADAEGRARFVDLPVRELTVGASSFAAFQGSVSTRVLPGGPEIELRLRRTVEIRGRVVDADGKSLFRPSVSAVNAAGRRWAATSEPDGTFRVALADDEPGPLSLNYQNWTKAGFVDAWVDDVKPGATDVEIVAK